MEANAGLVAGSHNRNELVVIRPEHDGPRPLNHVNGHICQICGDDVGITSAGELFVACNECAFPVCRPCYEYERKDGNQICPQCKTRYKRHKGSPRVNGDDEEEGDDDLEHEFNYADIDKQDQQQVTEAMLTGRMTYGRPDDDNLPSSYMTTPLQPQYPLLTNGTQTATSDAPGSLSGEQQALMVPPGMGGGGGKRVHPLPFIDSPSNVSSVQARTDRKSVV